MTELIKIVLFIKMAFVGQNEKFGKNKFLSIFQEFGERLLQLNSTLGR